MGFGKLQLACCGGCETGYETQYSDDFEGDEVDPGWRFYYGSFENVSGRFKPVTSNTGGFVFYSNALRDIAIDVPTTDHAEVSVTILRPFIAGSTLNQSLSFGKTNFIFAGDNVVLVADRLGTYRWIARDYNGLRDGYVPRTIAPGDRLKITLDKAGSEILGDGKTELILWDVTWLINDEIIKTDLQVKWGQRYRSTYSTIQHCSLSTQLMVQWSLGEQNNFRDFQFDDYDMFLT